MSGLFMDEIWLTEGSHSRIWATQKVGGSEALNEDQVIETKVRKEGWMLIRSIVGGRKGISSSFIDLKLIVAYRACSFLGEGVGENELSYLYRTRCPSICRFRTTEP